MEIDPSTLPPPPTWALELGTLGRGLVISGAISFVLCALLWLFLGKHQQAAKLAKALFIVGTLSLFGAFASLTTLFITNQFEFEYVSGHGDLKNTIPYRIAGVWAGQEGSFMLWAVCAGVFGLPALLKAGVFQRWFGVVYAAFLGTMGGILAFESPFKLIVIDGRVVMPPDGQGLSPALQNYWVTIHPPTIFLGFGALTVPFAFAVAALITKRLDSWTPVVRPWALIAMTFVGVGLCMGGFWAYETLGWGGFWMWDPVENTSFVPWILMTAFAHGVMVQTAKRGWTIANPLLGGMPFIAFVYGTFLTRSGLLADTSVHSFAQMNTVALKLLLGLLGVSAVCFVGLWAVRAVQLSKEHKVEVKTSGLHREGLLRIASFFLMALAAATAIGMSMPMVMSLMGQKPKVVEEGLYYRVLPWIFLPLMFLMAVGPLVSWKGLDAKAFWMRVYGATCSTLAVVGIAMIFISRSPWNPGMTGETVQLVGSIHVPLFPWFLFLTALCTFAVITNVWRASELLKGNKMGLGAFAAHIGVAVLMTGLVVSRGLEQKQQVVLQEGGTAHALGETITWKGMTKSVLDRDNRVLFDVSGRGEHFVARPGFYYVQTAQGGLSPMVWPHIQRHLFHDVYFTLHPRQTEASDPVTLVAGQTARLGDFDVTYIRPDRQGEPGQAGTQFGAELRITAEQGSAVVTPMIKLGGTGIEHLDASLGDTYTVSLASLDAASGSATVQLMYAKPIYPIEVFYKPLTILVWIGTVIIAIAGIMSAWYRRPAKSLVPVESDLAPVAQPGVAGVPAAKGSFR